MPLKCKNTATIPTGCPFRRLVTAVLEVVALLTIVSSCHLWADPLGPDTPVRGWTLLSENEALARKAIAAAADYQINHLQISHKLIHDLNEVDKPDTRDLVNRLVDVAHGAGIEEVVLWDHALYSLDYYPERFRSGPGGLIDLDNPEFWEWLKADYRRMLDQVPAIDGIILTFIETGAHAEDRYSEKMAAEAERLAAPGRFSTAMAIKRDWPLPKTDCQVCHAHLG